jgi:hypothetical protein
MNVTEEAGAAAAAGGERQPLLGTRKVAGRKKAPLAGKDDGQSSWLLYGQEEGKTELQWRETQNFYFMIMASAAFIGMVFAIFENEILWYASCLVFRPFVAHLFHPTSCK